MKIEIFYTTKELLKIRKSILRKSVISNEDLKTLNEIKNYFETAKI